MDLYFKIVTESDDPTGTIQGTINDWLNQDNQRVKRSETDPEILLLSVTRTQHLKSPVNALNQFAQRLKLDFELGTISQGTIEPVCYFGAEEGRPDIFEIGLYLDL